MLLEEKIIDAFKNILVKEIEPYVIYLFGSAAAGTMRADSDIDIAFFSNKQITDYELYIISQRLADLIKKEVDLIDLNKASTVFKAQIVGKGKIIYCNDTVRRMDISIIAPQHGSIINNDVKKVHQG